jgi:hypothetical protein
MLDELRISVFVGKLDGEFGKPLKSIERVI